MKRGSLRTQLIGWNIAALAALLCVLGVVIRYTIVSSLNRSVERTLESRIRSLRLPPQMRGGGGFGGGGDRRGMRPPWGEPRFGGGGPPPGFDGPPPGRPGGPAPGGPAPGGPAPGGPAPGGPAPGGPPYPDEGAPGREFSRRHTPPPDSPADPRHFDTAGRPFGSRRMLSRASFDAALRGGRSDSRRVLIGGEPYQVLSVPMRERGSVAGVGQIAYPLAEIELAVASVDAALLTLLPVGLLGAALGGTFLTNRVLSRVRRTTQAAESIISGGSGNEAFASRLPVSGNDEFSELSATVNGLLERLETAYQRQSRILEQQRRFTADASHELKTPLTVIKGTASMALGSGAAFTEEQYRAALTQIDRASTAMAKLVQDLLALARADSEQMGQNRIDLLAAEIIERALQGVPHAGHRIVTEIPDPHLAVRGNESELTRLLTNLLDNAVRYTPAGGTITVSARAEGNQAVFRVADTGVGIAPEHLAHIGERFYRADASRARADGGTGLGISICRGIAAAHNGTLHIDSKPGTGTTVTVRLPHS